MSGPCTDQPNSPTQSGLPHSCFQLEITGFLKPGMLCFLDFSKWFVILVPIFHDFLADSSQYLGIVNSVSWQIADGSLLQTRSWFPDPLRRLTGPWGGWRTLCLVFHVYSKLISFSKMNHCGETEAGQHEHSQRAHQPSPSTSKLPCALSLLTFFSYRESMHGTDWNPRLFKDLSSGRPWNPTCELSAQQTS